MRRIEQEWGAPSNDPTHIDEIASWYTATRSERDRASDVSDRTWRDLDGDVLFRGLDHTRTPLGRQRLYAVMREADSPAQRSQIQAIADACERDLVLRGRLVAALAGHRGTGGYRLWQLIREPALATGWALGAPVVTVVLLVLLALVSTIPKLLIAIVPLAFVGLAIRLFGLSRIGSFMGPLREISPVLRAARKLETVLNGDPQLSAGVAAIVNDLRPARSSLRGISRWARLVNPEWISSNELAASLYEYVNLALLLDINALVFVSGSIRRSREELLRVCRAIGLVDVALSTSSFRSGREWCSAKVTLDSGELSFRALRHPLLPAGVANDAKIVQGVGLLLTGANMSGKSTLLRAMGTNVLLARAFGYCTSADADIPVTDVLTCIGHTDDLERGVSYFYAEAEAVAEILARARHSRALILFDELFRGTNAAERLAASEMTLRHLVSTTSTQRAQFVAIATHDLQLGDMLADCFVQSHLHVQVDGPSLTFTYALTPGAAKSRTALALLRRLGVDEQLLANAAVRAEQLER